MENSRSKNKSIITAIIAGCLALLLFIIWLVFISRDSWFDETMETFFYAHITVSATSFMRTITFLGNHNFLIPANLVLIAIFLARRKRMEALRVTLISLSSLGVMSLLKNLFQRNRPLNPLIEGITNYSFPSGHAFMSVAFFGLLIYYCSTLMKTRWPQSIIITILLLLILIIGISRIYLNVHYATDVIAGWILGCCWLIFCVRVTRKMITRKSTSYN